MLLEGVACGIGVQPVRVETECRHGWTVGCSVGVQPLEAGVGDGVLTQQG